MAFVRHLALRCRDVENSRCFYEEAIGFKFVGYRPSGVSIDMTDGNLNITLLPHDDQSRPQLEEGEEYIHFGVFVDDLEGAWNRLKEWGAKVEKTVKGREALDPEALPAVAFKAIDPDGNVIDVTCDKAEWRI